MQTVVVIHFLGVGVGASVGGLVGIRSQPLPLHHDPLVADVDEHLEFLYDLVFLAELLLQILYLLLGVFLDLVRLLRALAISRRRSARMRSSAVGCGLL